MTRSRSPKQPEPSAPQPAEGGPIPPCKDFCARRGAQWLSREDLQAHLASLLRVENIGLLLGAGASVGKLGGKTMAVLWEEFKKSYATSYSWLKTERFVPDDGSNVNIELLSDALEMATIEWKRVGNTKLEDLLNARSDLARAVVQAALLNVNWWKHPSSVEADNSALKAHRVLLQKLTASRQPGQPAPWVFTTNYDLAVEWAAESISLKVINGFDGLHRRVFSPHNFDLGWKNTLARGEARFGTYHIYAVKVHGSLSWLREPDGGVVELPTAALWNQFEDFLSKRTSDLGRLLILPSAAKYLQTIGFVLGELFRRIAEFLANPQTALVINGYSFSDEHLNRLLVSALQNPTLQLVIYLPEASRSANDIDLDKCSPWVQKVLALESPQVTIVGGRPDAFFESMAHHFPDPAVYDEHAARIRELVKELV